MCWLTTLITAQKIFCRMCVTCYGATRSAAYRLKFWHCSRPDITLRPCRRRRYESSENTAHSGFGCGINGFHGGDAGRGNPIAGRRVRLSGLAGVLWSLSRPAGSYSCAICTARAIRSGKSLDGNDPPLSGGFAWFNGVITGVFQLARPHSGTGAAALDIVTACSGDCAGRVWRLDGNAEAVAAGGHSASVGRIQLPFTAQFYCLAGVSA